MKEELIKSFQKTITTHPHLKDTFACLGLSEQDVLEGFLRYDTEIGDYDNSVYGDVRVLAALYLKYFVTGSYHIERQNILTTFLEYCGERQRIADIGCGAPGLYIKDFVLKNKAVQVTLFDKYQNAVDFSQKILTCAYPHDDIENQVSVATCNLDVLNPLQDFDTYILFDSIEHALDPTKSMDTLVQYSPNMARFILSIPICSKEGNEQFHFIEWLTDGEARSWLRERQLDIIKEEVIGPTKEDVWAVGVSFHNLIVLCKKVLN